MIFIVFISLDFRFLKVFCIIFKIGFEENRLVDTVGEGEGGMK